MLTFTDEQLRYRIALSAIKGMNRLLAETLISLTGDVSAFFTLSQRELAELTGWDSRLFSEVERGKALMMAGEEVAFVRRKGITPLFFTDADYPQRLLECDDAPLMLYYKGCATLQAPRVVSIVGTRHATPYGKNFVETLVRDIAEACPDTLIVSGLAYGIDVAAHRAALRYGLPTVGVLAHGLNTIYPAQHRNTAIQMLESGGLLTEYTSSQATHKGFFLARNRIVAGVADAVVVVESGVKGGSLFTATIAGDYHRDVFALPGRVGDIYSMGCNELIRNNKALLLTCADDLIEAMGWASRRQQPTQASLSAQNIVELTAEEQRIMQYLATYDDAQINRMAIELNTPIATLSATLVELEFKGCVIALPGGVYRPV
ncbi:MAG: DNA-processing protein DprA [Bacteroidaceae bacterium]|nr:DNA-processing protein DprA [Bacteroidaceae bacterium]